MDQDPPENAPSERDEEAEDEVRLLQRVLMLEEDPGQIPVDVRTSLLDKWKRLRQELDASKSVSSAPAPSRGDGGEAKDPSQQEQGSGGGGDDDHRQQKDRNKELEARLDLVQKELEAKTEEREELAKQLEELHASSASNRQKILELEQSLQKTHDKCSLLMEDKTKLETSNNELANLTRRRQDDIDGLHAEKLRLSEELGAASAAKCEALIRVEDVQAKEISIQFREKRLEEERELTQKHIADLTEDLHRANTEALNARRQEIARCSHLQVTLDEKSSQVQLLEGRVESIAADKELLQSRLDDVAERLRSARESSASIEEEYRHEIRAQTKLVEAYKAQAEDSDQKSTELAKAVTELQAMLKEASDRYGTLEDYLEKEKAERKEEVTRRNKAICSLKKELDDANELIKTLKHRGLTEEGISQLSPAAAAASKLIKSGMSLTQVYSQLVQSQEDLLATQDENRRLSSYIEQILFDIEERAPALKQQRDDFERALVTINDLTQTLADEKLAHEDDRIEAVEARQRMTVYSREAERMKKQIEDLGLQVVVLVREVEAARTGMVLRPDPVEDDLASTDAEGIISERLVSFRNVTELQQKNMELLAVVREMAANQERAESQLVEERTADLKRELESVQTQVEELREARRRQELMLDTLVCQRDTYKSLAESNSFNASLGGATPGRIQSQQQDQQAQPVTSTPSGNFSGAESGKPISVVQANLEARALKAESALEEVKKDFAVYREEKCENQRILTEQLDKTREELNEARAKAIKYSSKEEWNNERFKMAQSNAANYKKELGFLEDKNKILHEVVGKHEQAVTALHKEVAESRTELARAENRLTRANHELEALRRAETRLQREVEILQRQKTGTDLIAENLRMVQVQLEKAESEARARLQNENDGLKSEADLLRKKLDDEAGRYRASMEAWRAAQADLELQLRQTMEKEREGETKLRAAADELSVAKESLKVTEEKLELLRQEAVKNASSTAGSKNTTPAVDSAAMAQMTHDLQAQVHALKNETIALRENLKKAREATQQYRNLADAAEKQVMESNEASRNLRESFGRQIDDLKVQVASWQAKVEEVEKEKADMASQSQAAQSDGNTNISQLRVELEASQQQSEILGREVASLKEFKAVAETDLRHHVALLAEARDQYEREVTAHGRTAQTLIEVRSEEARLAAELSTMDGDKVRTQEALAELKRDSAEVEGSLRGELSALKDQFEVVEAENKSLYVQMSNLSQQMTSLRDTGLVAPAAGTGSSSGVANLSRSFSEEDARSTEQLMDIIKYLRKEKEILTGKVEVIQAQSSRLKVQFEAAQKELEESRTALRLANEKAGQAEVMPSSRFAHLMEQVQSIPALSDSNRVLREEKDKALRKLEEISAELKASLEAAAPLKARIASLEEAEEKAGAEMEALKADNQRWRSRANQLIEKHQKINPEELVRTQAENSRLAKQAAALQAQLKQAKLAEEKSKTDVVRLSQEALTAKQKLAAFAKRVADLEAANRQVSTEREAAKQEAERLQKVGEGHHSEAEVARKDLQGKEQALAGIREQLQISTTRNSALLNQVKVLRQLGRNFKDKSEKLEKELAEKVAEMGTLEKALDEAKKSPPEGAQVERAPSGDEEANRRAEEAEALIEESAKKIEELEDKVKQVEKLRLQQQQELEEDNRRLNEETAKAKEKESRAKGILYNAKEKMTNITNENKNLRMVVDELKAIKGLATPTEVEALKKAYDESLAKANEEKDKLVEQVETLKQELGLLQDQSASTEKTVESAEAPLATPVAATTAPATSTASASPATASVKPVISTAAAIKQSGTVQPQAHVTPTRHNLLQTATIRPTSMRAAAAAVPTSTSATGATGASVLSSVSAATATLATGTTSTTSGSVQPTALVVGQSVSSGGGGGLGVTSSPAAAAEVLMQRTVAAADHHHSVDPSVGVHGVQSHHGIPAVSSAGPSSTSASTMSFSVASVAPTPKRQRDEEEAGSIMVQQKKLRCVVEAEVQPQQTQQPQQQLQQQHVQPKQPPAQPQHKPQSHQPKPLMESIDEERGEAAQEDEDVVVLVSSEDEGPAESAGEEVEGEDEEDENEDRDVEDEDQAEDEEEGEDRMEFSTEEEEPHPDDVPADYDGGAEDEGLYRGGGDEEGHPEYIEVRQQGDIIEADVEVGGDGGAGVEDNEDDDEEGGVEIVDIDDDDDDDDDGVPNKSTKAAEMPSEPAEDEAEDLHEPQQSDEVSQIIFMESGGKATLDFEDTSASVVVLPAEEEDQPMAFSATSEAASEEPAAGAISTSAAAAVEATAVSSESTFAENVASSPVVGSQIPVIGGAAVPVRGEAPGSVALSGSSSSVVSTENSPSSSSGLGGGRGRAFVPGRRGGPPPPPSSSTSSAPPRIVRKPIVWNAPPGAPMLGGHMGGYSLPPPAVAQGLPRGGSGGGRPRAMARARRSRGYGGPPGRGLGGGGHPRGGPGGMAGGAGGL